ncbi:MAG: hypothetical protein LAO55_07300 [Acidobacteriia bacterium]|nr:hypothetical protein [Terriglobia bacterium]
MNIYRVWDPPLWKVGLAQLMFWSDFIRPMSAIYYLPLFKVAGFNPIPYNVVRLLLLLANTAIFYYLARSLSRSRWVATLAAVPIAYHAGLAYLAYSGSFIYDILCGGFYFAALLYYVRLRRSETPLRIPHFCVFLGLYICALNSKEMAVTFPVVVLAYELLFKGRNARFGPVLIAAAVTAIFILGKTGHGSLTDMEAYRPVFTWARFAESNTRYLNTIFYTDWFTMQRVLLVWAVVLFAGVRQLRLSRPDPRWLFLWVWVVVTPLPITFLPDRGGAMLYIVLAGWAMLAVLSLRGLARRIARDIVFKGIPRKATMLVALAGCVAAYVHETQRKDRPSMSYELANGQDTRQLVDEFKRINIRPAAGSRILFLNHPFPNNWVTFFVATLVWQDRSLDIQLQKQVHLSPKEIEGMDYIFDFVDDHFIVRKPLSPPL